MSAHFTTPTDELLLLAETLGEVKTKADKLEAEFATQARPLEAATNALSAALSGIKALQFHVLDNNLGALSARVEEMRKAVDEQVGVIALELKKADETNAAKAGQEAEALRSEIAALQAQLGTLGAQFSAQLERVEFSAKEEAKKLQLIPGPAGAAGASLNPRGTFIDGETYNRLDVVSWLGSSYIAAVDGVTEKPSRNSNQWQVLASRGGGAAGGAADFGSLAGVAQINQGGTGQTTRAAGLNALLPSQTGNVQYMLLTDGAGTVSWGAQPVAGLPSQTSNGGKLLTTDGTNASWSGAITVSGSNATVTGTLTANGLLTAAATTSLDGLPTAAIFGGTKRVVLGYNTSSDYGFIASADSGTTWKELHLNPSGGLVKVPSTSASTTTSTGALVVGNGTSGGLGVGGSIYAGDNINSVNPQGQIQILGTGNTTGVKLINMLRSDGGDAFSLGLTGTAYNGVFLAGGLGNNEAYIYNAAPVRVFIGTAATNRFDFTASQFKINPTTASTSTASGALVVSGGVGVAGAQYLGVKLNISTHTGDAGGIGFGTETNLYRYQAGGLALDHASGAAPGFLFRENGTSTLRLESNSGVGYLSTLTSANLILRTNATTALTLDTSQNAIFAGTIRTAAPVGGTAASWKLGTVATVSPTSPNRTIEVDIGGTIYYIHAKTTNN